MLAAHTDAEVKPASKKPATGTHNLGHIAKQSSNPMSSLWMLWLQNDTTKLRGDLLLDSPIGEGPKIFNSTVFQPVMSFPFKLKEKPFNFIFRPVIQYHSTPIDSSVGNLFGVSPGGIKADPKLFELADDPWGRTNGFGDTALMTMIGPSIEDGFGWGVGITQIFPTAEHDVLGQEKWQIGPAVLIDYIAPHVGGWNKGLLVQHWASYAGNDDRANTSLTNTQVFLNYRLSETEMIGMTPNIIYDWQADGHDALTLPVGLGYSKVIKMGKIPVRLSAEIQYNIVSPDNVGGDWNLRLMFIPIVPKLF